MILYLTEQGLHVSRESQRLQIKSRSNLIQEVRLTDLEQVVIMGRIEISTPAIQALLKRGIDVHFLTSTGQYLGKLSPMRGKNIELKLAQYRAFENQEHRLALAKAFVAGKIENQRRLLRRHNKILHDSQLSSAILALARKVKEVQRATSVETLLGIEGQAANIYFDQFPILLKSTDFTFPGRKRRPPPDPVNALLSLGYTILMSRMVGMVERASLDPYLGFLHSPDYGRPSLALDLMEEWRPTIVDALVIRLLNWGTITLEDFTKSPLPGEELEQGEYQIRLTKDGLKKFLSHFHNKVGDTVLYPLLNKKLSYKNIILQQIWRLQRALKGEEEKYQAFLMPL